MSVDVLLSDMDSFIKAPNGIKRLKALILDMAISGKLAEKDDSDDDVNKYVSEIYGKRNELIQLKKAKSYKKTGVSLRGNLPGNWACLELGEVFVPISVGQNKIKTKDVLESGEFPVVDQGKSFIAGYSDHKDKLIKIDSPVIVFGDHTKALKLIDFDFIAGADGVKILLPLLINPEYFFIVLKSYSLDERDYGRHYKILLDNDFPLPAIQEQKRIVAKVDELMALCDQLEAQQQQQANTLLKANTAAIQALLSSENSKDALNSNWQRLADNFHTLYGNTLPMPTGEGRQKKHLVGLDNLLKLRKTIIHMAVYGKLTNQIHSPEDATVLLDRINVERAKILDDGYPNESESKKQISKQYKQILPNGLGNLPEAWSWATLMQCSLLIVDCHNKTAPYSNEGTYLLRTNNIRDGKLKLDDVKYVDDKIYQRWAARTYPESGDILITREAPMGEVAIIPKNIKVCMGQRMMLIRLVDNTINNKFLLYSLMDPYLMDRVQDKPVGATVEHLRVGGVETVLVPVPPLEDQKRIIYKLDELMSLCDKLEKQLTTAYNQAEKLITATTKALVA